MDGRFQIRHAAEADLAEIVAIERACFSDPWSEDSFRSFLGTHGLVAVDGARVVGYVFAREVVDAAELLNVAVAPACRRAGIGRALVARLCRSVELAGIDRMFLEVRESNVEARELYRTLGFVPVGRRRRYYRRPLEDALILARTLEPDSSSVRSSADG